MSDRELRISAETTPNPDTIKFNVTRQFFERGSVDFKTPESAQTSPLVKALFDLQSVQAVLVGSNFITVTRKLDRSWPELVEPIVRTIRQILEKENDPLGPVTVAEPEGGEVDDQAIAMQIRHILDSEIRPAVAQDGGDIVFYGYKEGVVTLHLQGACSSCPSSIMTLKMGVENRLKQSIPQVREVVQL